MSYPNPNIAPQSFTFRDAKGFTGVSRFYINNVATTDDGLLCGSVLQNAIVALSNAANQGARGPVGQTGTVQYGTAAQYLPIYVKAVLLFQDSQGGLHRYRIPSPKAALFLADLQTINPANALVMAFIAAMLTPSNGSYVCTKGGEAIINFFGGMLYSGKPRHRYGFLQLTPALTAEEPGE